METERDGVSAAWLCCFLREAPTGAVVRGYEGEFVGMVIEKPANQPRFEGEMVELAIIHNDCRVDITEAGKKFFKTIIVEEI